MENLIQYLNLKLVDIPNATILTYHSWELLLLIEFTAQLFS